MKKLVSYIYTILFVFMAGTVLTACQTEAPTQLYTTPLTTEQPERSNKRNEEQLLEDYKYREGAPQNVESDTLPALPYENKYVERDNPSNNFKNSRTHKIALLVPLSGDSKEIGKAMRDTAQLAIFDINISNFELLPLDTKGTPEGAVEAAQKAINENADLILGPLFSSSAKAIAPIADRHNINVISFSNDESLTDEGIFLLGFMPEQQVRRVVNYASRNSIEEFSIIAPKNKFGDVVVDEFRSALSRKFKRPKHVEYYDSIDESLSLIIRKFAKPIEEEEEESEENNTEEAKDIEEFEFKFNKEEDEEKTVGILVPEGGRSASNIAARLFRHGLDSKNIRLLGTGQWDDVSLEKEKKLVGSWFATSSPKFRKVFEKHFKESYGYKPVRIASLAYDGVALAAYLASKNNYSSSAITNRGGFSGVNGVFRIRGDGTSERALAIIEITERGFKVVEPAPNNF